MTNVIAQLDTQPTKTLVADAVENYGVQGGNFNLTSTSVIADVMKIIVVLFNFLRFTYNLVISITNHLDSIKILQIQ